MAGSIKVWVNGSAPQCEDDDLNGFKNESNNLILHSGQALNTADNDQTSKAASVFAAGADFYTDSGSGTAYVLAAVGLKTVPPVYFDGMRIRFKPANTNSGGAGATVKVGALAAVSLRALDGTVLDDGMVVAGVPVEGYYVSATGFFNLTSIATAATTVFRPWSFHSKLTQFGSTAPASAWHSSYDVLEVGSKGAFGANTARTLVGHNYYDTGGGGTYIETAPASFLDMAGGDVSLYVAPSGTAGTAIAWTQALKANVDGGVEFGSPVGGSQGPGTGNFENGVHVGGVELNLPTEVTGWVTAQNVTIHGASASNGIFDINAVIGGAWESVGPTGSGATNIWTALDVVPSTAKALILGIAGQVVGSSNGTLYDIEVHARATGAAVGPSNVTRKLSSFIYNRSGSTEGTKCQTEATVPIDSSGRFDMYSFLTGGGTRATTAVLVGWVE